MMQLNCLLVFPYMLSEDPTQKRARSPFPPLGLMYVAASLRRAGFEVKILDCTFKTNIAEAEEEIRNTEARYIGIYSMITLTKNAIILARAAKINGRTVIFGGPDPSTAPEKYLKTSFVDYVVIGEGENTAVELLRTLARGETPLDVKGLAFMHGAGSIVRTPARQLEMNLDFIPLPARDLIDNESYKTVWRADHGYALTSIMTTRGCPYGCFFCSGKLVFGRRYSLRTVRNVMAELQEIVRVYGYDRVWFADDIFPARKDRTLAVCREIIRDDLQFSWSCLARPELVDEETLAAMKTAGCEIVFFGVESGSQRMLDAMNRMMTIKQIVAGTTAAKNAGLKIHTFMMVGFPGENYESIERTIDFLKELSPDEFSFTVAYPLPGTELFQMVQPIDDRIEWGDPSENRLIFKSNVAAWALRFAIWKAKYEFYMYRRARRGQTIFYIAHSLFKISTDTILRLAMPKETATPQFDERKVTSETTPRFPP